MAKTSENQRAEKKAQQQAAKEQTRVAEENVVYDVVCGRGVRPDEAIAQREYKGQTYFFCCRGCLEAFDTNPEAYIGAEPVRAYVFEETRELGPDQARLSQAQAAAQNYAAQIADAEARAKAARDNLDALRRQLEDVRADLNRRRAEMQSLGKREDEIRAALKAPDDRLASLEAQVERERTDFANAEQALNAAKANQRANLMRERGDIDDLQARERGLSADLKTQERRAADLEARINELDALRRQLEDARADLNRRRAEMQALGKREDEIRAALKADDDRIADLEGQVARVRAELANAQEELDRARAERQAILMRERGDLDDLQARERGLGADVKTEEQRTAELEARINQLDAQARDLDKRAADLRQAQKAAQDELNRIRNEKREVTLEGMPAVAGEEPAEFYTAHRVERPAKGKERHGTHS